MRHDKRQMLLPLSLAVVVMSSLVSGLSALTSVPVAMSATTDGVSLRPAAGQFMPLDGTAVLDSRNGTGLTDSHLAPGSTLTLSVTSAGGMATGVPVGASAVVLEYHTLATFAGVLWTGPATGATDTSLTFPAGRERNGFDITTPATDVTVALAITGFAPIPAGAVLSKLVVRLHG